MTPQIGLDVTASPAAVAHALDAERLGFDYVSVSDHPYGRTPSSEVLTLLTWIAARTSRIGIASRVLAVPFRRPAVLAKVAETLDRLSGGRLILGLGAGHSVDELRALGATPLAAGERVTGLAEAVDVIRGAWTAGSFSYGGRIHTVTGLEMEPKPARAIPIWLGTYGPRALAVTGRLADGWIPSLGFAPPEQIPVMRRRIDDAATAAGRDPRDVRSIYNVGVRVDSAAAPRADIVTGSPAAVAARLRELVELGFAGFNLQPHGDDRAEQVARLAAEVLPALRA